MTEVSYLVFSCYSLDISAYHFLGFDLFGDEVLGIFASALLSSQSKTICFCTAETYETPSCKATIAHFIKKAISHFYNYVLYIYVKSANKLTVFFTEEWITVKCKRMWYCKTVLHIKTWLFVIELKFYFLKTAKEKKKCVLVLSVLKTLTTLAMSPVRSLRWRPSDWMFPMDL